MSTTDPQKIKVFQPVTKKPRIKPSDEFKKEVFAKKLTDGLTVQDAAIVAGYRGSAAMQYGLQMKKNPIVKKAMAEIFEKKARLALKKLTPDKADQATFSQLAHAAAELSEKARLERGQSTSNTVIAHVDFTKMKDEDIQRYLEEKSRGYSAN